MRTLTEHPKTARQPRSATSPTPGPIRSGRGGAANSIHHLPRTIGNQAVQRLLRSQEVPSGGGEAGTDTEIGIHGIGPVGQAEVPVGCVGALRPGDPRAVPHDFIAAALHGPEWDFGRISLSAPDRTSRPPPSSPRDIAPLPGAMQAKLVVGQANDPLEHEADRVADQVMRMPAPPPTASGATLHRTCACQEAASEERERSATLHTKQHSPHGPPSGSEAPAVVHEVLHSAGQPLDAPTRAFFEPRFGRDFSGVRAHADDRAARSAQSIGALAYTVGPHIVFAQDQYAPGSDRGRHLLAHELAHTIQQRPTRIQRPVGAIQQGVGGPLWSHASEGVLRRDPDEGPRDAGVPLPAGVPEPRAVKDIPDAELGWEYQTALDNRDLDRADAIDQEMDKRFSGWGTAVPRGPDPVVGASGAVTPDVALRLLDNMARGEAPFKPELGLGGASWFTTEGNPYTSVNASKSINVQVEIAKGSEPLVFREADLLQILKEALPETQQIAEKEFRERFGIPNDKPLTNRALKKIERTLDRFNEKRMWTKVAEKVAASQQKVGEVVLEPGSRFSESPGKFAVVAEASKVTLKGGVPPLVDALAKQGVGAEPVVIEAAEALAKKLHWAGRVRTAFHYGGRVLIVVAIAADLYKIYLAQDKLKAVVTSAGGWAGATAAGAAFAAWFTPGDAAGPWAWAAHGVGTLIAGGIGYWFGSETTRYIYELVAE
jgi:hypothetical protein